MLYLAVNPGITPLLPLQASRPLQVRPRQNSSVPLAVWGAQLGAVTGPLQYR